MKNIYKRQPIQRELPPNYDDLDAVNYTNLNAFKGLQVYDNPLIADQSSTYSCKNVYVDEHANLTVRPALFTADSMQETVVWRQITSEGRSLIICKYDNPVQYYTLKVNDSGNVFEKVFDTLPTVVPVEVDNILYIFVQAQNTNVLWKLVNGRLEETKGAVLLDDPVDSDISHYNILNDKVNIEYAKAITESTRPEKLYTEDYQIPIDIDWSKPYNITIAKDKYVICSKDKISIITKTGLTEFVVDTGYQYNNTDWCVDVSNENIKITVKCYRENSPAALKYFEIDSVGIVKQYSAVRDSTDSDSELFPANGYALVSKVLADGDYQLYLRKFDSDFTTAASDMIKAEYGGYPIILDSDSEWRIYGVTDYFVIVQRTEYDYSTLSITAYSYTLKDKTLNGGRYGDLSDTLLSNIPIVVFGNQSLFNSTLISYNESNGGRQYNFSESPLAAVEGKVYLKTSTPSIFVLSTESIVTYPVSRDAILADDNFVLYKTDAMWRSAALAIKETERPTDVIPVLSDINERVITGFFLDNCWWFVTEHSIFGTGVDGNGLATIERFDPLKYFKFSETITGAIRLSDTSFWVFHDSGAYLIYKTSLTLLNNTEYRWLCTATAKSKGCDFENALIVMPVSNNVVTVTSDDICAVQMKENIQSDERSLVPITLSIAADTRQLLAQTESVKICTYKYLTLFILNKLVKNGKTPALVYDNVNNNWWFWEFPVNQVASTYQTETNVVLVCPDERAYLSLTTDEYLFTIGALEYEVYADRILSQEPIQIEWGWQSAMQIFGTVERRKQLLFTTFVFDDFMPDDRSEQLIEFGYYFNIYSRSYATSRPDSTTATVYRISNNANKTTIASFNYLQLVIHNADFDDTNYEALTKPKICSISFKYRLLRGELT